MAIMKVTLFPLGMAHRNDVALFVYWYYMYNRKDKAMAELPAAILSSLQRNETVHITAFSKIVYVLTVTLRQPG
jgi:preprotein translocase subunit YajC